MAVFGYWRRKRNKEKEEKKKKRLVCKYPIGLIRQQLQKYFNFKKGEREREPMAK
jgi:hypothetical protein